jgi:hypothetical protein
MAKRPAFETDSMAVIIGSAFAQFLFGFPVPSTFVAEFLEWKRRQLSGQCSGLVARLHVGRPASNEEGAIL